MNKTKFFLLWVCSLFMIFSFSVTSFATTTTSQAGIFFTENNEVENEKSSDKGNKEVIKTEDDRMNLKFPQAGEYQDSNIGIIGLILIMAALIIKKAVKQKEEER